jgi:hypothetical protein
MQGTVAWQDLAKILHNYPLEKEKPKGKKYFCNCGYCTDIF